MKKLFVIIVLLCSIAVLWLVLSNAAEDDKRGAQQKARQKTHTSKPILPPVVPTTSSNISPTPSPHIASPSIEPATINTVPNTAPAFHQTYIPSSPVPAVVPTGSIPVNLPQVPIIANTIGRVLEIGSEKDGSKWIQVKDQLFEETIRIIIRNTQNIPIVKQAAMVDFNEIKIGDRVNVIFNTENEDNTANFISILTEEELEVIQHQTPE